MISRETQVCHTAYFLAAFWHMAWLRATMACHESAPFWQRHGSKNHERAVMALTGLHTLVLVAAIDGKWQKFGMPSKHYSGKNLAKLMAFRKCFEIDFRKKI